MTILQFKLHMGNLSIETYIHQISKGAVSTNAAKLDMTENEVSKESKLANH